LVTLVATDRSFAGAGELAETIRRRAAHVVGVVLNVHPSPGNAPLGAVFETLCGAGFIEEASGPFRLRVSAGSFFQVNPAVGAAIHDAVRAAAVRAPAGRALDLYGGVGATALRLASDGRSVTLVEGPGPGADDAEFNVRSSGAALVTVHPGRVEVEAPGLLREGPSVVVVNPPRSGLPHPVLDAMRERSPECLLYVSCDPQTLARDVAALIGLGFRLESVAPFDLMPQTPHVEALAILSRVA
jgi:23S rRNA (uracil1939-C5)-methyltransferase